AVTPPRRTAGGGGGGNPARQPVRIRHQAPYRIRCRADIPGLLEISHSCRSSCRATDATSIPRAGHTEQEPAPAVTAGAGDPCDDLLGAAGFFLGRSV